ncbi:histidine phosphatase family protein [Thalassospira lohafexi]|uniref:Phosphoglycerate mutase n=1 Tax=Thalassospira lohafexi TaxID=744227 RepID=A0A2N3L920_9PROT|nr:histidine phosphatase family protein [Thalassospira lohafexi]PKR59262.1 phosphoglycerate mutase [Thalassospira lohafexi]
MNKIRFALLRHGVTDWNAEKRIQGRSDISLRADTIAKYQTRRLPNDWQAVPWFCTPLSRTRETADALAISPVTPQPDLIEMDWGDWEGQRLPDIRKVLGAAMAQNEDRGWAFRPDGGESPQDVLVRVQGFLARQISTHGAVKFGAITHKGVIRSVYAAARGWDMMGKIPDKLNWECLHVFDWSEQGGFEVVKLNIALIPAGGGAV